MEYRQLGGSGFKVPVLSLGTGTFGGGNDFFKAWGASDVAEATRLVDICLEAGLTMFDSADIYSQGQAEEILGQAIKGRRQRVIISTKGTFRFGEGLNDVGSSRYHVKRSVDASLKRLGTDYIDLYQLHGFDAMTPPEEVLGTFDDLVRAGKILYVGCSNFSGWHLMKSLAVAEKYGLPRYVAHQAYYSLIGRDYEWELMPLALDQKVGAVVWSPLGWGRLTGKIRRGQPLPETSRLRSKQVVNIGPPVPDEYLYRVVKGHLPEEGLAMIRYHSFYAAHREGEYAHLMDERDHRLLGWVRAFNPYDLYSKGHERPDVAALTPYTRT